MKKPILFPGFTLICCLLLLVTVCKNGIEPPPQKTYRISKMRNTTTYFDQITHYFFREDGKPASVIIYTASDSARTRQELPFTYDGQQITGYDRSYPSVTLPAITGELMRYEISSTGRLTNTKSYIKTPGASRLTLSGQSIYQYDTQGRLTRIVSYSYYAKRSFWPNPVQATVFDFVTVSASLKHVKITDYLSGLLTGASVSSSGFSCLECYEKEAAVVERTLDIAEFDDKVNPYYEQHLLRGFNSFEPHNLLKRSRYDSRQVKSDWTFDANAKPTVEEYQYEYNADRLPIKRSLKDGSERQEFWYNEI